jgi:hypothetical protein
MRVFGCVKNSAMATRSRLCQKPRCQKPGFDNNFGINTEIFVKKPGFFIQGTKIDKKMGKN